MSDRISPSAFHGADGTEDWRVIGDGATAFFRADSFAAAARFVEAIAGLPGLGERRPPVDIRADGVTVTLVTMADDYMGMTTDDVALAAAISSAAHQHGLTADPSAVQSLLVVPGAPDITAVIPFWRAILGYEPRQDSPDEDLVDPRGRGTPFWFEQMREPRGDDGGAIHIAVWVPPEQAETRVQAALAAGGRMVRDDHAPSWWTLADAAGNEADISSITGRD
jgi:4a-hydroxytetrahydrobiopterin dehydratase